MSTQDFVTVRSLLPTIPLPRNKDRPDIITSRLVIRALRSSDLEALHSLRIQEPVMKWTKAGCIDKDIEQSKAKLDPFLGPNDAITANCAICLKDTGAFIGIGGCHLYPGDHGWPEVGYMLRTETWGQGIATEFLSAWLQFWSELPRAEREIQVQKDMVDSEGAVEEQLIAITNKTNAPSQKVLIKAGFQRFREFTEVDDSKTVDLVAFRFFPSKGMRAGSV
ncbi:hypothetical protein PENANT_c014G10642 [Penicillium antarcticum]|uniref:N-acetyltransferase domain-containing protein n=1 Tax=Penicillium antarcticum TaxID=416450 RepID=A0A1V6Q500_9EURO|nr:uncharacterized protein N7508_009503 [Penicillium antarcticum]KAJ5294682.1 hypothetical protein N7508_009503 [Penicillium antarcticum]OQD84087.1 hypothetical protein PENANT_c014G10642 [Penicillium antarcticum]